MTTPSQDDNEIDDVTKNATPRIFTIGVFLTFFWIMIGISFIYGFRLYHNAPIHPSFLPIVGAAFAASLSFALVLALEFTSGQINLQLGKGFKFTGASGPIILWCICFVIIAYGLYLLGFPEAIQIPGDYPPQSLGDVERDIIPSTRTE